MAAVALPRFDNPPIVETVFAMQIREIPSLSAARVGQLWGDSLIKRFPNTVEQERYEPPIEQPGAGTAMRLTFRPRPSVRSWFLGDNELVQLQSDWVAYNWKRSSRSAEYPHYDDRRRSFADIVQSVDSFVRAELDAELVPTQVEATYVNVINTSDIPGGGRLSRVLESVGPARGAFLPPAENAQLVSTHAISKDGAEVGRLHVDATASDESVRLALTARGAPLEPTIEGALAFLDIGHQWIVESFKDLTTETMWQYWQIVKG